MSEKSPRSDRRLSSDDFQHIGTSDISESSLGRRDSLVDSINDESEFIVIPNSTLVEKKGKEIQESSLERSSLDEESQFPIYTKWCEDYNQQLKTKQQLEKEYFEKAKAKGKIELETFYKEKEEKKAGKRAILTDVNQLSEQVKLSWEKVSTLIEINEKKNDFNKAIKTPKEKKFESRNSKVNTSKVYLSKVNIKKENSSKENTSRMLQIIVRMKNEINKE